MNTERLIDTLAHRAGPVQPLAGPRTRSMAWLLGTLVYFGVLLLVMTSVAEIAANASGALFVFQQLAAVSTAAAAAGAAFALTVPGHATGSLRVTIVTGVVWVASVGLEAITEWSRNGLVLAAPGEPACVAFIVLGGTLPGLAIAWMLRRGAPLAPGLTMGLGALATTTLASLAACVAHPHPSASVTLAWHGTAILALVAIAVAAGRAMWTWDTSAPQAGVRS